MNIAILGSRGIPANYSGFETCAEELAVRLVACGHSVSVYCCKPYSDGKDKLYKGVRRIVLPTIRTKHLEKVVHAAISLFHVSFTRADHVLMLGLNIPMLYVIPRMAGKRIITNVDGLEWKRKKWGRLASRYFLWSERVAAFLSNCLITDAKCIQEYYLKKYGIASEFIPYGAEIKRYPAGETLRKYSLEKDGYILYVGRFEPENNPLVVREAYELLSVPNKKLVMVGDSPFSRDYVEKVKDTTNPDVIFAGFLYGEGYRELVSNAYCYVQATEVGGTHPALIEAMGFGNCVLANDVPEHREVLMESGMYYNGKDDLAAKMEFLLGHPEKVNSMRKQTREQVRGIYSWNVVTKQYEDLFAKLTEG